MGITEDAPRVVPSSFKRKLHILYAKLNHNSENLYLLCASKKIPYFFLTNKSQDRLKSWVKSKNPDLIVVYSMSHLLRENIIKIPKCGVINLHPSLLPSYRGPNPVFWAYYNMEVNGGITIHYIDKGEDTGDIIFQKSYEIPLGSNGSNLQNKMITQYGIPLLMNAIDKIDVGKAPKIVQPTLSPTLRARNISPDEQMKIINWEEWDIERIWHLMRGYSKNMDLIDSPKNINVGQRWEVEGYNKCNTFNIDKGKIIKLSDGYCVAGKNGIIYLNINWHFKNTLRWILKQIMK